MYLTVKLKQIFKKIGITIDRYPTGELRRRMMLIRHFGITKIFDIGANRGQYAILMRSLGFKGKIISFEPLNEPFQELIKKSANDNSWEAYRMGLGDSNDEKIINVSENIVSSSFHDMLPVHLEESPDSKYISKENVEVKTLDSLFPSHYLNIDSVWVKIDTQGYEMNVLRGAMKSLDKITAFQVEMHISQTYKNCIPFVDLFEFLENHNFKLFSFEPGYYNKKSGQLYQVDGIFFRKELDQK